MIIHDAVWKAFPEGITRLSLDRLARILGDPQCLRFATVRNPVTRIFSAWQSKLLLQEPLQSSPYREQEFFKLEIEDGAGIARAFEGFLEHLARNEAPNFWDAHWTPQFDLLRPDLIHYTIIAQIENPGDLRRVLADHLGPRKYSDPFGKFRSNESLLPFSQAFVSQRSFELIKCLFRIDFEWFGYEERVPDSKVQLSDREVDMALRAIRMLRGRHQRIGQMLGNVKSAIRVSNESRIESEAKAANLTEALRKNERTEGDLKACESELNATKALLAKSLAEAGALELALTASQTKLRSGDMALMNLEVQLRRLEELYREQRRRLAKLESLWTTRILNALQIINIER